MIPRVKIYGERNTGTNIIERLIADTGHVRTLPGSLPYRWMKLFGPSDRSMTAFFRLTERYNLGWKHSAPNPAQVGSKDCAYVVMAKNPYSWLLSLNRRPYHNRPAKDLEFREFIRTPWPVLGCEGLVGPLPSPIALWNEKYRAYLAICNRVQRGTLVRYEDFLSNTEQVIRDCASLAGAGETRHVHTAALSQGAKSRDRKKSVTFYKEYYLGELWKNLLTDDDINYINRNLDTDVVRKLGYEVL